MWLWEYNVILQLYFCFCWWLKWLIVINFTQRRGLTESWLLLSAWNTLVHTTHTHTHTHTLCRSRFLSPSLSFASPRAVGYCGCRKQKWLPALRKEIGWHTKGSNMNTFYSYMTEQCAKFWHSDFWHQEMDRQMINMWFSLLSLNIKNVRISAACLSIVHFVKCDPVKNLHFVLSCLDRLKYSIL